MLYYAQDFKLERNQRRQRKIKNKRALKKGLMVLFFTSLFLFSITTIAAAPAEASYCDYISYEVNQGDTLWKVADQFNNDNMDIREYIYEIRQINSVENCQIYPGQVLEIPVIKTR